MKHNSKLNRSRWLLLTLFILLVGISPAWGDELTVYDGTATNSYIPVYGSYADTQNTISEFIIPSGDLEDIEGATLSAMTFYLQTPYSGAWESAEFEVYMKEVTATTFASASANTEGTKTVVYTGSLDGSQSTMDIAFSNNYTYNGGNLLVGIKVTTAGTWKNTVFYGVNQASGYYTAFHYATSSKNGRDNFLPKVTFTYTPGATVIKKPANVIASDITANSATISWDAVDGADSYEISYSTSSSEPAEEGSYTSVITNSHALTGLTPETTYYVYVRTIKGENHSKWSAVCSFTPGVLTINNVSTTTNNLVPIYGNYMDDHSRSQFIISKASIASLSGTQITKIVFYGTANNTAKFANKTFDVYFKEVDDASISSLSDWASLENVYSGNLTISDGKMTITLDGGYDYSGDKNLLIGINQTDDDGDFTVTTWTGVSATGASMGGYGSSVSQQNFLPQTTFYFAPQTATVKKPKNLAASATATTTATLGWTDGEDGLTEWQIAYSTDTDFNPDSEGTKVAADANPFTLTELTAATTYYAYVRAKKGEDYSGWSNKAEFTTLSAVPVIELSTTSHNFGMVSDADAQALTLTISNTGGAALTGLTVTPTSGFAVTDMEGNALATTTIAAGSSLSVKVKMNAVGQQNGTVTIDGTGVDEQVVTVSGYMLDDSKICETFASNVPNRWTKVGSNWVFTAANGAYGKNEDYKMTTPQIVVAADQVLVINAKVNSSSSSLKIEGSADNGENWVYTKTLSYTDFGSQTSNFVLLTIDDIDDAVDGESNPVAINKLRLTLDGVYMNAFNGFTYADVPEFKSYSNEGCTVEQVTPTTKNFGFATEAQSQKYYFKNTGNGQVDLSITAPDGITAEVTDNALTELESTDLTITMPATEGFYNGNVVVTAKNHSNDEVMGTFEVAVNGAVTGTKNYIDFTTLSAMPAGWNSDTWTLTSNSYVSVGGTAADLTSQTFTVAEGEKMMIEAQATNATNELKYSFKVGSGDWSDYTTISGLVNGTWKAFQIPGTVGSNVKVKFNGTNVRIRRVYGFTAVAEPSLEFAAAGTTKDFGMVASNTTSDAYTITNNGGAELTGLTVTCNNANFTVAVAENATSIPAGESVTFTVTLTNTNKGAQSGTVTIAGDGVESKTLNVKGYVADDSKIFTTFTALPDRWTNANNYWTFSANGASATSSSSKLETPKIVVAEGQKLAISAKLQYSGSYYVTINGSSDNGATWTAYTKTLNNTQLNNTDYTVVELDDVPTTVNKLQLVGYYVYVNGLNGFTYDENDPEFSLYADSECTDPIIVTAVTNAWGFVNEDKTATYYIKNTGTGTMNLTKTDAPTGFTATLGATSLGTGEKTSLTIAMANNPATNEGYHAGDVVLTAKDNADNTLGTFTVTSSGVVVGSKTDVNFTALDAFPAGWETTGWSVTANTKATVGSTSKTLTTSTYQVANGESMVIRAKANQASFYYPSLSYRYTTDGGSNWSSTKSITPTSTSEYEIIVISDIPEADEAVIEFTGKYIDIERIYGYTAVAKPAMTLSPAATNHDFGMQTAAAEYVITVTNSGTAEMTNLAAALTGDDAEDFEVAVSKSTVPYTGENTATVTVTLKASTEYKEHNATLTISADGLANKEITLTGKTRDGSKWYVDFASEIPSSFVEQGSWSVTSQYATTTSSTENSLITQPINLAAGEKIYFDAYNPYSGSLKVRYSLNGGISWSNFVDYTPAISTSGSYSSHEIDLENASAVTAVIEFKGRYYIRLDNVYGGTLNNTASMIKVTKSAEIVENGVTEPFGSISTQATATYTITNVGNGTLTITSPVATTGVATAAVNATSLGNGESATLTITMPVEAPYGEKSGAVTVNTSLGNFVINYTATTMNPNALDEQFASGKPAGWYFGGYWEIESQTAQNSASGIADLITEQLTVAGPSDKLTFKAAKTGSSAETFRVYTSQDRVTWDAVDLGELTLTTSYQDVNISGLAAGDYYVKITGARVKVDNFLGWTKKNNTRDLYVTATSFPAATTKGNKATITADVTSLIADETGVYAKLFIDGSEEATAAAQDVALNGTTTFSFTYAIPEKKTAQIKVYYSGDTEAFATAVNTMKVNYALSETSSEAITTGIYDVTLTRSFQQGWNSICLPFAVEDIESVFGEDAKVYQFTSYTSSYVTFETVGEMSAGTPYLIKMPEASSEAIVLNDCNITTADAGKVEISGVTFQGTYAPKEAGTLTGMYGITTENDIRPATADASMDGFRAYLIGSLANARIMIFDETTGIKTVYGSKEILGDGRVYNLNGQHVENAKKGVYIVNGKKVVIK